MAADFTQRKEAWARKMQERGVHRLAERSTDRLPPGQHLASGFPVLDLGIHPKVKLEDWKLEIAGEVEVPLTLSWAELVEMQQDQRTSDFHCVTTWSKYDCAWSGVLLVDLLDRLRPHEHAQYVFYTSYDGYTTNTLVEDWTHADALLATHFEGKPITLEHGAPARIVIPHLYAWKSAKFVRKIEFLSAEQLGYWEKRGYSNTADPWLNDRFAETTKSYLP